MRKTLIAFAIAATVAVPAGSSAAAPERSKPICTSSIVESVRVPMRDGETLYVFIERPVVPAGVKVPVILTLSPYDILNAPLPPDVAYAPDSFAEYFVPRGYALQPSRPSPASRGRGYRPPVSPFPAPASSCSARPSLWRESGEGRARASEPTSREGLWEMARAEY